MSDSKVLELTETAIAAALALVLSFISINYAQVFYLELAVIPLLVLALRRGVFLGHDRWAGVWLTFDCIRSSNYLDSSTGLAGIYRCTDFSWLRWYHTQERFQPNTHNLCCCFPRRSYQIFLALCRWCYFLGEICLEGLGCNSLFICCKWNEWTCNCNTRCSGSRYYL
jgi:Predicted membrane protein